jgi:hypothetical protein
MSHFEFSNKGNILDIALHIHFTHKLIGKSQKRSEKI